MRFPGKQILEDQLGQVFIGYVIAIMLIAAVMASVMNALRVTRRASDNSVYQNYAIEVARMGFEDGLSFFRRQPDGVSMAGGYSTYAPTSQANVVPWPMHPDAAFNPQSTDTDHWTTLSMSAQTTAASAIAVLAPVVTARGIVRTFPLLTVSSLTVTAAESKTSPLWGRWVIRRQNLRNWSPGPNTMIAYTDPEAAHDLTHLRTQAAPGSGNYWSITARGYVMKPPAGVTLTAGFEVPAMFEGGCYLSAPKRSYLNKPLLLATAKVYGEFFRINFNDQASAIWVSQGNQLTVNTNGIVAGSSGVAVARGDATSAAVSGTITGSTIYSNVGLAPTVSNVFPGLDKSKLQQLADYVGGVGIFPTADQVDLTTVASRETFYYLSTSATAGTAVFPAGATARVMTGVGLVFVDGNLQMDPKGLSTWSGIIFVNGNVSLRGPVEFSGTLIATGTITVGNTADINKGSIEYNPNAVLSVKSYLQGFKLLKNSVVATTN